jgi:hypothetical protein
MTTGLTKLSLYNVALQPHQAQQDSKLGAAQLLQLLARLTALRVLTLTTIKGHWPQQQLSQYSALTASSNLQELQCNNSNIPGAALAHVFPAGRQLPNLQRFFLHSAIEQPLAAFDSLGIARLASCCPAVEDLNFTPAADVSLAPLKSLSALTHLHIGPVSPAVIRSDLTALAQLQSLDVSVSLPAAGAGEDVSPGLQHLLPLTALTGLTCFSSWCDDRYMGLFSNVSQPKALHACTPQHWHV